MFLAFDVETANLWRGSLCQYGFAAYGLDGGLSKGSALINPLVPVHRKCFAVHGLSDDILANALPFAAHASDLFGILDRRVAISHTAFDGQAIESVFADARIAPPQAVWVDSCEAARAAWPDAHDHKLNTLMGTLGAGFRHHDAEQDALAAAYVFLQARRTLEWEFDKMVKAFSYRPQPTERPKERTFHTKTAREATSSGILSGHVVVFTGPTVLPREELARMAASVGADVRGGVTGKTTFLVSGWPDGKGGNKVRNAQARIASGQDLAIIDEAMFMRVLAG